jgi:hypothetical protein
MTPKVLSHTSRIIIEKGGKIEKIIVPSEFKFNHLCKKRSQINKILNRQEFAGEIFNEIEENEDNEDGENVFPIPKFCIKCFDCSSKMIYNNKSKIFSAKKEEIDRELIAHGHEITSKKTLSNKKKEIILHYQNVHNSLK